MDNIMQIHFIAGASGAGKTAVVPYLTKILPKHVQIHDFDDIGVPADADKKWRQESTEKWLQKLLNDNKDACIVGQMVLGEILACPSAKKLDKINFLFLDVSDIERITRLKHSSSNLANQNMLNWASWLRMHHQNPNWHITVIEEDAASIMDFSQLKRLSDFKEVANLELIDTTGLELNDVATKIMEWINNSKVKYLPDSNLKLEFNAKDAYYAVDAKLFAFNKECVPATQKPEVISLNLTIKDGHEVIAGICSDAYIWNIVYISVFFVEEAYRHQGLGTILLNTLEEKAKQLGVGLIHLDTFDFQAKDFYLKHGYEIFGVLDDCPQGHRRYYMKKVLFDKVPSNTAQGILEILKSREPIFHHPEILGTTIKDIENQMSENFWEVGASGNIYSRQDVIKTLVERYDDKNYQDIWEASDFKITHIAHNAYLVTYYLIQDGVRHTRRSTIWLNEAGRWRILYHQGTVISE